MALPPAHFGTSQIPNLLAVVGKEGYLYLLNGASLGGVGNGAGGGDNVVARIGPNGGVWGKPAVWPGDGGYLYTTTTSPGSTTGGSSGLFNMYQYGLDGTGKPTVSLAAQSTDSFGIGSGSPVVTSNGTTSGTALVWTTWAATGSGSGAQIRAYSPVPVGGAPNLVFSASIGQVAKFASPGVAGNRVYVGTGDGHVLGFGAPLTAALTGSGYAFPSVIVGNSAQTTLTVTANSTVALSGVAITAGQFSLGQSTPALPATLQAGATLSIPVTFTPTKAGMSAATVTITTSGSPLTLSVSGTGVSQFAQLVVSPSGVSFGGTTVGSEIDDSVTITNGGGAALTINSIVAPAAPFGLVGAPAAGLVMNPGDEITMTVTFNPSATGMFSDSIGINSTGGMVSVMLSGSCAPPGQMTISPLSLSYGEVGIGSSRSATFTVANTGGTSITITKSKPPALGLFVAGSSLAEGTTIGPNTSLTETVTFSPTTTGTASDTWVINSDDGNGLETVQFTGSGGTDATSNGTAIALITAPTGGGSKSLSVISDNVFPPLGSTNSAQEYDTYTGATRTEDWIGYQFPTSLTFGALTFQDGIQFSNGGWFTSFNVQVLQCPGGGTCPITSSNWVNVPNVTFDHPYGANDGKNYETYNLSFAPIAGSAIRLDGVPGGSATFISVGELRVYLASGATVPETITANAGPAQSVASGATVTLDGTGSFTSNGDAVTYAWTQTAGTAVTLSSATAAKPTFTAPTVTASTPLTFSLVVSDGSLASTASTVTITVTQAVGPDITSSGTAIALITAPTGAGSKSLSVISDNVFPPVGSSNDAQEYDTYNGKKRTEDWIGYQYTTSQTFGSVTFQPGIQFSNGGWFTSFNVQVLQCPSGTTCAITSANWVTVPNVTFDHPFGGNDKVNYETYNLYFAPIAGTAIRLDGVPGGSATFISVGELRIHQSSGVGAPETITANAGSAQSVAPGATVTLDGTGSSTSNGDPVTYAWTQTAGPAVTLSSATAAKPTFTAPAAQASTALTFSLVVSDGSLASTASTVTITVVPAAETITANAGPAQSVASGASVTLDGTGSSASNGDAVTYAWTQTGGPTVTLSSATAAKPTFTAPTVTTSTALTFSLVVSDGALSSTASTVTITVAAGAVTETITANAGPAQSVASGATVTLDGTGSSASNGDAVTYAWTQTGGSTVTLSSATAAKPTFTAPTVTASSALTFSLVVSDGALSSTASTVTITVAPPASAPGSDVTSSGTAIALITAPTGGGNKSLSVISDDVFPAVGSSNSAQEYDTYTGATRTEDWIGYQFTSSITFGGVTFQPGIQFSNGGWFTSFNVQVLQCPGGGTCPITSANWVVVPNVTFDHPYPGNDGINYETYHLSFPAIVGSAIRLDGAPGGSKTFISVGELRILSSSTTGPETITANAGPAQGVASGATVTLNGTASSTSNGDTVTYAWTQTGGPAVTLSSATAAQPTFTAPTVTASTPLTFSLVVSDGTLSSTAATVTITVAEALGADITSSGTAIALITAPTGGGNKSLSVISDNVFPPVGSSNSSQEYDTYNGKTRTEDWIGYQYTASQTFGAVTFQPGIQFSDGGWFTSFNVQVLQCPSGTSCAITSANWVTVSNVTFDHPFGGNDKVNYETYNISFTSIAGTAIRLDGVPGGSATFISVGELRIHAPNQ